MTQPSTFPRRLRSLLLVALGAFVIVLLLVGVANLWILNAASPFIVTRSPQLPDDAIALVLGTSPKGPRGYDNPFFTGRVTTAADLFLAGKARHILVSGDNSRKDYDEPSAMRDALVERGVSASAITLDHAGFRTLDSVVRAKAVFGLSRVLIVTDDFHQPRAIFLARSHGIEATGCPSRYVPTRWSKMARTREVAARVKAWLDVYVLRTKPKFYGPPVAIPGVESGAAR